MKIVYFDIKYLVTHCVTSTFNSMYTSVVKNI